MIPRFPLTRFPHRVSHSGESSGGLLVRSKWGKGKGKRHVRGAPVIFNSILAGNGMSREIFCRTRSAGAGGGTQ